MVCAAEAGDNVNNFQVIYKILRLLDKHKCDEAFDYAEISAKAKDALKMVGEIL